MPFDANVNRQLAKWLNLQNVCAAFINFCYSRFCYQASQIANKPHVFSCCQPIDHFCLMSKPGLKS